MQIFIDESGTFALAEQGSTIGAVGALVVTDGQLPALERRYARLRPQLPTHNGEVKGRLMDEVSVARVADLARRMGLIFEITVLDMAQNSADNIHAHRLAQCEGLTKNLTVAHNAQLIADVWALRRRLEQLPLQPLCPVDGNVRPRMEDLQTCRGLLQPARAESTRKFPMGGGRERPERQYRI